MSTNFPLGTKAQQRDGITSFALCLQTSRLRYRFYACVVDLNEVACRFVEGDANTEDRKTRFNPRDRRFAFAVLLCDHHDIKIHVGHHSASITSSLLHSRYALLVYVPT